MWGSQGTSPKRVHLREATNTVPALNGEHDSLGVTLTALLWPQTS